MRSLSSKPDKTSCQRRGCGLVLYVCVACGSGVLFANGLYLMRFTWFATFHRIKNYEDHSFQLMFLRPLGLGLLLIVRRFGSVRST